MEINVIALLPIFFTIIVINMTAILYWKNKYKVEQIRNRFITEHITHRYEVKKFCQSYKVSYAEMQNFRKSSLNHEVIIKERLKEQLIRGILEEDIIEITEEEVFQEPFIMYVGTIKLAVRTY